MDVGLIMMLVIGFLYIYLFLSKKAYLVERFIDPNLAAAAAVLNTKTKESPKVMTNSPPINTGELKRGCRESIFVEQMKSLWKRGDVLIAISCSGNSPNVVKAAEYARANDGYVIGLIGFSGGKLKDLCQHPIHFKSFNYK
jgi:uncharacterized phosphosugar-binding protein